METQDKINRLEQQIRQSAAAEQLNNYDAGRLLPELITEEITRLTREVVSDKYIKDHQGYVNVLAELRANQKLLKKFQLLMNSTRTKKLREAKARLEEEVKENS